MKSHAETLEREEVSARSPSRDRHLIKLSATTGKEIHAIGLAMRFSTVLGALATALPGIAAESPALSPPPYQVSVLRPAISQTSEHVILLHGMCRTNHSMSRMAHSLRDQGYTVWNIDYPSRSASVAELSEQVIPKALAVCETAGATKIHFVTHSLGGILVRSYLSRHEAPTLGRVVMLGPPNCGSEVVDCIGHWKLFDLINGPSGQELGTSHTSTPNRLGPAHFSLGVIAGSRSINWINSTFIPGPDDGKVSVQRTRLDGMKDHVVIATTHTFMMQNPKVIHQTVSFLKYGAFEHAL